MGQAHAKSINFMNSFKDKEMEKEFRNYMSNVMKKPYFYFSLIYSILNSLMVISYWIYTDVKTREPSQLITPLCMIFGTMLLYGIGLKWPIVQFIGTVLYFVELAIIFGLIYPTSSVFIYRFTVSMTFLQIASVMRIFGFEWILGLGSLTYITVITSLNIRFKSDPFLLHYNLVLIISILLFLVCCYAITRMQRYWYSAIKFQEKESKELKNLLNCLQIGIIIRNHKEIKFINNCGKDIFKVGNDDYSSVVKETAPLLRRPEIFMGNGNFPLSWVYNECDFEIRYSKIDAFGEDNILITLFDITKMKNEQKRIYTQNMLHIMSHDIRSPAHTIHAMLEEMQKEHCDEKNEPSSLAIAMSSCTILLYYIDDMQDLISLHRNKLELKSEPFSMESIVNNALTIINHCLQFKTITILREFTISSNIFALGDSKRSLQIILNFLLNSLKYSTCKSIKVKISNDIDYIYVSVEDGENNIAVNKLEPIYERLGNFNLDITQNFSGIGLIFCSSIAKKMNGCIKFDSNLDEGTIFSFALPCTKDSPKSESQVDAAILENDVKVTVSSLSFPKVLIINPDEKIYYSLQEISVSMELQIYYTKSVGEAIGVLKKWKCQLVLVEMGMINEIELLRLSGVLGRGMGVVGFSSDLGFSNNYRKSSIISEYINGPLTVSVLKNLKFKYCNKT